MENRWYEGGVQGRDVESILAMSIMDEIGEDERCWKFTTYEDYTVKSAYHYTIKSLWLSER